MEYFTDENVAYMPSWARAAFLEGSHDTIVNGASRIGQQRGARRLDAMVFSDRTRKESNAADAVRRNAAAAAKKKTDRTNVLPVVGRPVVPTAAEDGLADGADWDGSGIYDCSVNDVAVDYNIPVEFVVDIMLTYGVTAPIAPTDGIRDRLTTDEIEKMLLLISSFDSMDLADRYSDRTVEELADDYDVDVFRITRICEAEDIYLPLESATRLQLSRESRVVDIVCGSTFSGQAFKYPSLLDGLDVELIQGVH
jgi:hypothetical protein